MNNNYKHWHLNQDEDNVLWLNFDRQGQSANSINDEVLAELNQILDDVKQNKALTGLIIQSAKEKGFIAGADVKYFSQLESTQLILDFLKRGQEILKN